MNRPSFPALRNPLSTLIVLLAALTGTASLQAGCWYGEVIDGKSEIMMMDVRWPWFQSNVYCATWNARVDGLYFYGGFAGGVPPLASGMPDLDARLQDHYRGKGPWSFWGANKEGVPPRGIEGARETYLQATAGDHEGASCFMGGAYSFLRRNTWFTLVNRVWLPLDEAAPQCAYLARFAKDVPANEWHCLGVVRMPTSSGMMTGNGGFLEVFNGKPSLPSIHRRFGYYRQMGEWKSSNTVSLADGAGWFAQVKPENDHEFLALEYASGMSPLPASPQNLKPLEPHRKYAFVVKQPAVPSLDQPKVARVSASSNGKQVVVQWELDARSSPQLLYSIEVFGDAECKGKPLAVCRQRMPQTRMALVTADVANPVVRFSMEDLFDQPIQPVIVAATRSDPPSPALPEQAIAPGLAYELFESDAKRMANVFLPKELNSVQSNMEEHHWLSVAEIKTARRVANGVCKGLDLSIAARPQAGKAITYRGFLAVPTTGIYVLHLLASDGFSLNLDGKPAIAWDSPHGTMTRAGTVNLEQGLHPFSLDYFVDRDAYLQLEWEGPGMARQPVPVSALVHSRLASEPVISISATPWVDAESSVEVSVDGNGHAIHSITLYDGRLPLAKTTGRALTYRGPLFNGTNDLHARVDYDKNSSMDSAVTRVDHQNPPLHGGWELKTLRNVHAPQGICQTAPDAFSLLSEGQISITRKITGNFTLTCRVDDFTPKKMLPSGKAWVGLMADGASFGVYQTAASGIRTTANFADWGGSNMSSYELPKGPWLRMVRDNNVWTGWTSTDGKNWVHGATHAILAKPAVDAGLTFKDSTIGASAWFHARVSALKLEQGLPKDLVLPRCVPARDTTNVPITGLVVAASNPRILVARPPGKGLLRSDDAGRTWRTINGNLPNNSRAVRSVAIDPVNPDTLFCATGCADQPGWSSGLWKSTDGGKQWDQLDFAGDFDGQGPSAICPEILAFAPGQSAILCVACESKGFFVSMDAGRSWANKGGVGERFTCVAANPKPKGASFPTFHGVTCPDDFMQLLGRGPTTLHAGVKEANHYSLVIKPTAGKDWVKKASRTDVGYLSVNFHGGKSQTVYTTTHGVEVPHPYGRKTYLKMDGGAEYYRPCTAFLALGDKALFMPLDPADKGKIAGTVLKGEVPVGGALGFAKGPSDNTYWLLATDGIYLVNGDNVCVKML